MILTEEEIQKAYEALPGCPDSGPTCETCRNAITISNCETFTAALITCTLCPSKIPILMAKMIEVGMALADQKCLERLVGDGK